MYHHLYMKKPETGREANDLPKSYTERDDN